MRKIKVALLRTPILGCALLIPIRAKTALRYFYRPLSNLIVWLFKSRETTNFTYDLEENNKHYLASLIADITNKDFSEILVYIKEVEEDKELKQYVERMTRQSDMAFIADKDAHFGRRIGWYAFVRVLKPKIVVETGVDKGLGACVLVSALKKNKDEGYEGYYYGTDINPKAGYLLSENYSNYGEILYGDSIESLKQFDKVIDLFINDSDHLAEYEAKEYETVATKLAKNAIILGDNAHCTNKLVEFALKTGRQFIFFQEKPFKHWYPGAGIGIAFKREKNV